MKRLIIFAVAAVFGLCDTARADMRIWTSRKGDSVEAEYVKMYGNEVMLKTADGRTLRVPTEGLCDDDQEYLAHAAAVPPTIVVKVGEDMDRDKNSSGYPEKIIELLTLELTVRKRNPEPCMERFDAELYILGREAKNSKHYSIIDIAKREVSFTQSDTITYKESFTIKSEVGYSYSRGFAYEGYLFCVKNSAGVVVAMECNQNILERNIRSVMQSEKGAEYNEDFTKLN